MHLKKGLKPKVVNENRGDIGGHNRLHQALDQAAALEKDYDYALNDKPGADNTKAMEYLAEAIRVLTAASTDV